MKTVKVLVSGALVAAVIMILGTIWIGAAASRSTDDAVRQVSLFYLDELAGRREQVIASNLHSHINNIDAALELMDQADLETEENRREYQKQIKQLYGLERFAFIAENGTVYTSIGPKNEADQYSFDYRTLKEPAISIRDLTAKEKTVIIAMPIEDKGLHFDGQLLTVCFMEIGMEHMLDGVSLQSDKNKTTFCNIYSSTGVALTDVVLGGLASEDNLLDALHNAAYENGYSADAVDQDFALAQEGVSSFTYNGIRETMYYKPIEGTDWMLTYLIRESLISEQFGSVSRGIILRSILQMLLTVGVLIALFAVLFIQIRRASKLEVEKEAQETAARVKQEELEHRLELQEQLLGQERRRMQQDQMITALASDYRSVYYVELDSDQGICYQGDPENGAFKEGDHFIFTKAFTDYANTYVTESFREAFLHFIRPDVIREALKNEKVIGFRYLIHRDGVESYEMLRMAGVRHPEDRDDHIVHAIGVGFCDVDRETRETLDRSIALSDALKAAEEANKAKTAFLSNMSHEIRTPMNAIIGLDNIALSHPDLPAETRVQLEKIEDSAHHLLNLINDILDMSRIESGRMTLRSEEFSFSHLLEQINTMISGQCREKGLDYDCQVQGQLEDYYIGDDMKLRQVLLNILGNAVKFTPAGGRVSMTVENTARFDNKSTLTFVISDTGVGMDQDYLPKIFDAFSQEDSSTTNRYGSSGLGLAITKNIVEMMNGHIEVESEKGKGSTFTVTVTLTDSDRKTSEEDLADLRPQNLTVLVVDDDPVALEHAHLVLEQVGIVSETCLSGEEAVEMVRLRHARRDPYNMILVDWKMPGMDGVETTRRIRDIIGHESAIIILTAYRWDDVLEKALQAGVDSFIAKPLFPGNVLEEFSAAIRRKKFTEEPAPKADLNGRRILLAEDMAVNAEIIMMILNMRNMEVDHAENGRLCVEMFASHPEGYYDAILMDMRMPEMDGLTATREIRVMDRADAKSIPIIALTANAFDEDVQRSLQAGLNAHLSKPVEPDNLFHTLESLIQDRGDKQDE